MLLILADEGPHSERGAIAATNHLVRGGLEGAIFDFEELCFTLWREESGVEGSNIEDLELFDEFIINRTRFNPDFFLKKLIDKLGLADNVPMKDDFGIITNMGLDHLEDFTKLLSNPDIFEGSIATIVDQPNATQLDSYDYFITYTSMIKNLN